MDTVYFVMLRHPNKDIRVVPMTNDDDNMCLYKSEKAAHAGAKDCELAVHYGYEVFEM